MANEFDIDPKLSETLIHYLTESLYASGYFTDEDIKDNKSLRLALLRVLDAGGITGWTIDHTQNLIAQSRSYRKTKEYDFSKIFYATFFEHEANYLIHLYCLRNKIDQKTQTAIVQSVNIWGKLTWLLQLMGYPKINKSHLNTIKLLIDSRNAFVHFKWKDDPSFHKSIDSKNEKNEINDDFEKIEKAVKYFKNYCSKIQFKGRKGHIKKIIKSNKSS